MKLFGVEVFQSGGTFSSLPSVPKNEIVLFYKDTVVVGYTLLVDENDGLIYYTSGSGAGGHAGGASKPSGTWTQPNHSHGVTVDSVAGHVHPIPHIHATTSHVLSINEIPSHAHTYYYHTPSGYPYPGIGSEEGRVQVTANTTTYAGGGLGHDHGNTAGSGTGNSSADAGHAHTASSAASASANTWRPAGICFTKQQRI